jgi:hypothetical protein
MTAINQHGGPLGQVAGYMSNPFSQLPVEWVKPAYDFYSFFEAELKSETAICAKLREWLKGPDPLTPREFQAIFRAMASVDNDVPYKFASDVMDDLKRRLRLLRERERKAERTQERRGEAMTFDQMGESAEMFRRLVMGRVGGAQTQGEAE